MHPSQFIHQLTHFWLSGVVILLLQGIALYTWQFRKEPGARWQSYLQVCKGILLLTALVIPEVASDGVRERWMELYAILGMLACYLWLRCIAEISGRGRRFPVWLLPALHGVFSLFCLLALTNPWHHWFWDSAKVSANPGIVGYASLIFAYGQMAAAFLLNILWARSCTGLRRRQAFCFILPTICGWAGQVLSNVPALDALEPHVLGFLAAGVLMAWAFLRWRAYSILPLAQEALVEAMVDGLMIVDEAGYIVERNAQAREIFAGLGMPAEETIQEVFRLWPQLEEIQQKRILHEARLEREGEVRYFMVVRTPLSTAAEEHLGQILVFKEITVEKRQQEWILEQGKALSMLEERERLGRELHDGPGQIWSFLAAQTQAARLHLAHGRYPQADQTLAELQQVVKDSYLGLRESILALHTDLSGGMLKALSEQLLWYRKHCGLQTQLKIECEWQNGLLTPQVELQVLRILQEALANSRKSAQAGCVSVTIGQEAGQLIFQVEDDGVGFEVGRQEHPLGTHGLRIMQDRAHAIGGQLQVASSPGQGCRVRLAVAVSRKDATWKKKREVGMVR